MPNPAPQIPAEQRISLLETMQASAAFDLLCAKWNEGIANLEKEIFDTKTEGAKTHELKLLREQLTASHHPATIAETLIKQARSDAKRPVK